MTIFRTARLRAAIASAILLLPGFPAVAQDLRQATSAYRSGHHAAAAAILMPLAEDGDPFAQFAIGVMYDDGRGLPQDLSRALSWYTRAAQAGLADAQYMVGRFYGSGRGVKQDPARAFYWFNLAAAAGVPRAALLRDQHARQITPAERRRRAAEAVSWQARHPHHLTCRAQRCIYPGWTAPPRASLPYPEPLQPD